MARTEQDAILRELGNPSRKVILLHGQSGAGKTALKNSILNHLQSTSKFRVAKHICAVAPKGTRPIVEWLVQDLAHQLLTPPASQGRRITLQEQILRSADDEDTFVAIDNAEELSPNWTIDFTKRWLKLRSRSMLFIVSTTDIFHSLEDKGLRKFQLSGFGPDETDIVLSLVGEDLLQRFGKEVVLRAAADVARIPQYLLYLRWINPVDEPTLFDIAKRISAGQLSAHELWPVLRNRAHDLVHFFALGLINRLEIESDLLAFLWDMLGRGGADKYQRMLDYVIQQGFLARITEDKYGLHPSLHLQLEKLLRETISGEHVTHVLYYLSVYFRRKIYCDDKVNIDALYAYVTSSIRAKNVLSAASLILNKGLIERVHRQGFSLGYRSALVLIREALDNECPIDTRDLKVETMIVQLSVELARCESKLSGYSGSIRALDEFDRLIRGAQHAGAAWVAEAREDALYIRGIAEGCLGNGDDSLQAYGDLIRLAISRGFISQTATECLGYLALVESFRDTARAVALAEHAIRLARAHDNKQLLAITLCSTGQVMLYAGTYKQAAVQLEEAYGLLHGSDTGDYDRRELGRLLLVVGTQRLLSGEIGEAAHNLREAAKINRDIGDRRRLYRADMLLSICTWHTGDGNAAREALKIVVKHFASIDDKFYGPAAGLTYSYFLGARSVRDALNLAQSSDGEVLVNLAKYDKIGLEATWRMFVDPLVTPKV